MQTSEFLKKVKSRAGLESEAQAKSAIDAVFGVLRARISHAGGDNISSQLPKELRELWESGVMEHIARSFTGVDRMDLKDFLYKVQTTAHLANSQQAEAATKAVFMTLQEHITEGARYSIANQLPLDIKKFWDECLPAPSGLYDSKTIGPSAVSLERSDEQIEKDIEELLNASDEVDSEKINVHVRQGKVVLRGVVKSADEWEAAKKTASNALGVIEVDNELSIVQTR